MIIIVRKAKIVKIEKHFYENFNCLVRIPVSSEIGLPCYDSIEVCLISQEN